jgi:hypothetical protein
MDSLGDDNIARLLRLKRYEQPPPGYYENFLDEFRRRQRDEALREPFWSICVNRIRDFIFPHSVRTLAGYSEGIVTAAACVVIISIAIHSPPKAITRLAFQPVPAMPRLTKKGSDFKHAQLDMQATLQPGTADLLVLPASDETIPLNLEWDSPNDQ